MGPHWHSLGGHERREPHLAEAPQQALPAWGTRLEQAARSPTPPHSVFSLKGFVEGLVDMTRHCMALSK